MSKPRLDNGALVVPFDCDEKYKWWREGLSLSEILDELGASDDIKKKYMFTLPGGSHADISI